MRHICHNLNLVLKSSNRVSITIEIPLPETMLQPAPGSKLYDTPFSDCGYPTLWKRLRVSSKHSGINQNRCLVVVREDSQFRRAPWSHQDGQHEIFIVKSQPGVAPTVIFQAYAQHSHGDPPTKTAL